MEKIEKCLKNIADKIIKGRNMPYFPGLLHGKVGIAVFLCHYASHTQNDMCREFAYDLITEAGEQLHEKSPVNYAYGLSGIGTAIEYLVQNNYMEADTDEILEDIDFILSRFLIDYSSLSSFSQILDTGKYFSYRVHNTRKEKEINRNMERVMIFIEMQFMRAPVVSCQVYGLLNAFRDVSEKAVALLDTHFKLFELNNNFNFTEHNSIRQNMDYLMWCITSDRKVASDQIDFFIKQAEYSNLGLLNGLAGIGLTLLSFIDKSHASWWDALIFNQNCHFTTINTTQKYDP
jgi:hypothetical protein